MTPTGARITVETLLRPSLIGADWYVTAKRERRCCWDSACWVTPVRALGGFDAGVLADAVFAALRKRNSFLAWLDEPRNPRWPA